MKVLKILGFIALIWISEILAWKLFNGSILWAWFILGLAYLWGKDKVTA